MASWGDSDLLEAADWYDSQQSGVGRELISAVDNAIDRIMAAPDTFAFVEDEDIRSCPVDRFPYQVHFRIETDVVRILVIKHERQHPDYGTDRR